MIDQLRVSVLHIKYGRHESHQRFTVAASGVAVGKLTVGIGGRIGFGVELGVLD